MQRLIADEDLSWPLNKKKGEEFEIDSGYARTLMLLHKAHPAPPPEKVKRKYQRRDMTAENDRSMAAQASVEDDI